MNAKLTADRTLQAQLDRLVAGELPESDRRSLLAWLDEDATRWRSCALAFLEAQSWESAAVNWPAAHEKCAAAHSNPVAASPRAGAARARRPVWQVLALASAAALLFAAGHFSARLSSTPDVVGVPSSSQPSAPPAAKPLLASVPVRTSLGPGLPAQLQIAVAPAAAGDAPRPVISEYERRQWERRGFELEQERRYLPAKLPDGTNVLVPIDKVHVKHKGTTVS